MDLPIPLALWASMFAGQWLPLPWLSEIQALYTLLQCNLLYHAVTHSKPISGGLLHQVDS